MSTDIRLKHSKVASRVPTSGDLKDGELGLNLADEKIYMKNADGDVVQVAGPGNDYGEYVKLAGDATAQTITGTGGLDVDGLVESGGGVKVTGGDPNLVQSGLIKVGSGGVKLINSAANVNLTLNQADTGGEQAVGAEFTVKDNCIGRGDGGTMYGFRVNHPGTLSTTVSTGQYIGFTSSVNLTSAVDKVYGFYGATDGSTGATGISAAFYAANNTIDGISHNFFAAGASPNYFAGDVAIGESTTFFGNLGDAIALLPPTITEEFANIISSLPTAQPFTGDPTTLPADIPTPLKDALVRVTTAGKINLNSDGSATFAGDVAVGTVSTTGSYSFIGADGTITARLQQADKDETAFQSGYTDGTYVTTAEIFGNGSATFSNAITLGDGITGSNGAYLYPGSLSIRGDTINNESSAFVVYRGGSASSNITAQITQSGSASFANTISSGSASARGQFLGECPGSITASSADAFILNYDGSTVGRIKYDGSAQFAGDVTAPNITFNLEPDNEDNYTTTTEEYEETIQVPVVGGGVATADLVDGAPEQQFTEQTVTRTREIKTYTGPTLDVKETLLAITGALESLKTAAATATTCDELRTAIETALANV